MTLYEIGLLSHFHCRCDRPPKPPIYLCTVEKFLQQGLITPMFNPDSEQEYTTTSKGEMVIKHLEAVNPSEIPLPASFAEEDDDDDEYGRKGPPRARPKASLIHPTAEASLINPTAKTQMSLGQIKAGVVVNSMEPEDIRKVRSLIAQAIDIVNVASNKGPHSIQTASAVNNAFNNLQGACLWAVLALSEIIKARE